MNATFPILACSLMLTGPGLAASSNGLEIMENPDLVPKTVLLEELVIDKVWAANMVSFDLHTIGERQYVAYYDEERMMSIASRDLGNRSWQKVTLPNKLHWDSHNYVTLGVDEEGVLHVSGNMHANPLVYFRSEEPWDISSFKALDFMVGEEETKVTYPKFFNDREGRLLFSYRSGSSGDGVILINRYIPEEGRWVRHLNDPLFDGIGKNDTRSAYHKFIRDPEGDFHFLWIWRGSPLVETSHQICYAVSPDLIHWENAFGETVELPFRPDDERVIVDPVPVSGGAHNGRHQVILTDEGTPLVGYVKYDDNGLTQFFLAKPLEDGWVSSQISDWGFRWEFVGGGDQMTIGGSFKLAGISESGFLVVEWKTETGESGTYVVDPETLELVSELAAIKPKFPAEAYWRMSSNPELNVNLQAGQGPVSDDGTRFALKWEAMKKSHGGHAPEVIPDGPVSKLLLLEIQ